MPFHEGLGFPHQRRLGARLAIEFEDGIHGPLRLARDDRRLVEGSQRRRHGDGLSGRQCMDDDLVRGRCGLQYDESVDAAHEPVD